MILKELNLNNYLFEMDEKDLNEEEKNKILEKLNQEMYEIYYGCNLDSCRM
jgi:S-adenosylmethionine decarboxylase